MAKFYPELNTTIQQFISEQHMFFTATAAAEGRINLSPKGMDTFRCLDEHTLAYLDLTGSGNETAAHLKADGRMTIMFCAFNGKPLILRLYGRGEVVPLSSEAGQKMHSHFPSVTGERQIIVLHIESVQTSCGFAIPVYEFKEERDLLVKWAENQGDEGLKEYRRAKNQNSIDGLPTDLCE
ncbi:MAG: pyridoxamine 5-phosphate oxidase-related FMN-binding protein [Chthonomonadales bacterium]|nr:pyridoxamine 5-phosphate oxidase-related FMN-binding protein [Chthonomonadales bacterium]